MPNEGSIVFYLALDEARGKITKEVITNSDLLVHYVFNEAKDKPITDPLWRKGIVGNGLLFDGYSTYIEYENPNLSFDGKAITLTAWVAPRSYTKSEDGTLSSIVEQYSLSNYEGFLLGMDNGGTWTFKLGTGQEFVDVCCKAFPLQKDVWSFIAATFNYETYNLTLYLNGIIVAEKAIPKGTCFKIANKKLVIGKNTQVQCFGEDLNMNMFYGLMDEIKIYNCALGHEEIIKLYQSDLEGHGGFIPTILETDISLERSVYNGDRYRPEYHLIAPGHWMNEPHAPIYFNGLYHIFYQHNPRGPYFNYIHWGHLVSDDMVHWDDMPIALSPEENGIDPAGCWSGSATYDERGLPIIFYTAGDDNDFPNQRTAIARCNYLMDGDNNLKKWTKDKSPVTRQKIGEGFRGNFRDPFVFKQGNEWIQIIGASLGKLGGTALVYVSSNLIDWTYKGPLYVSNFIKYPQTGTMWELPVLLPVGKNTNGIQKYIFLINANEVPHEEVEVFYWIGNWDVQNYHFIPDHEEPKLLDIGGGHFTGPSGFITPDGRSVLFSISQGRRSMAEELSAGWAHNGGLPISLDLSEDYELKVEPIRELKSLRKKCLLHMEKVELVRVNESLSLIQGDLLEIVLDIMIDQEPVVGISVKKSKDAKEETVFKYRWKDGFFCVDRSKTTLVKHDYCKGIQGGVVKLKNKELKLHLFIDKSMIEVYINQLKCLTTRTYNSLEDSLGVELVGNKSTIISNIEIWSLDTCYKNI